MRCFRIDPRIYPNRLHRVGIEGNTLFLQPSLPNAVQLWSVDTLYPQSWKCLFHVNIVEHFYSLPCCSYQSAYLYVLVIAIREGERHGRASIFRVNRDTKHSEEFRFDETTDEFLDVPWETAELTCGKDESRLHIYDRAIVAGPIPFWNVIFNHTDTMFYLQRSFVPDPTGIRTDRFPILYDDPTEKTFVRMTANNSLTVFNAKEEKWEEYFPIVGSRINLASIASKGLQETMSRTGHRAGAVMSNLSIHTDGPVCIARVLLNHAHHFYRITLDHQNKEFSCEPRGVVGRLSNQKMYYTVVGEKIVAIIGLKNIIVAPLQPPTLAECCIWELQKMNSWVDENGGRSGGLSPTEIKDLLKKTFQNSQNLRKIISYSV